MFSSTYRTPLNWPDFTEEQIAADFEKFLDSAPGLRVELFHINYGDETPALCGVTVDVRPSNEHRINIVAAKKWPGLFEQVRICERCLLMVAREETE